MASASNSGRAAAFKRKNVKIADKFRGHCPPQRVKDLEQLVRQLKGDEDAIRARIQEWWDEPAPSSEPEWEDVNRKGKKGKDYGDMNGFSDRGGGNGYRNDSRNVRGGRASGGGGRGFRGRGWGHGRGGGGGYERDRNGGRGGHSLQERDASPTTYAYGNTASNSDGAYKTEKVAESVWEDGGFAAPFDSIPVDQTDYYAPKYNIGAPKGATAGSITGNVWATKGSAHIIEAEKIRPPPVAAKPVVRRTAPPQAAASALYESYEDNKADFESPSNHSFRGEEEADVQYEAAAEETKENFQDNSLPAYEEGDANEDDGWAPLDSSSQKPDLDEDPGISLSAVAPDVSSLGNYSSFDEQKSPTRTDSLSDNANEPLSEQSPVVAPPKDEQARPTGMLNMGRWDVTESDEMQNLDFGFGSFGTESAGAEEDASITNSLTAPTDAAVQPSVQKASGVNVAAAPALNDAVQLASSRGAESISQVSSTISPARPPPGLTLSGMPPMPPNAVLVHELEGKLERASLNAPPSSNEGKASDRTIQSGGAPPTETKSSENANALPPPAEKKPIHHALSQQPFSAAHESSIPATQHSGTGALSQNFPGYGMGMYNYGANLGAGNAFAVMPGLGVTGSGLPQQPKPQPGMGIQQTAGSGHVPLQAQLQQQLQQQQQLHSHSGGGLYGVTTAASSGTTGSGTSGTESNEGMNSGSEPASSSTPSAGMPPGVHGMPYNPALFYGQQHYQLGQPHGVGYGYGYGAQFSGAVQGGYGYQQVMGQNAGYGQPYDDSQHLHGGAHSTYNAGHQGYQKANHSGGGGGYRRGNNHNSHASATHQYQSQYNPQQHGGYGGQPYGMGYSVDHFNPRGGYGPHAGNINPYTMQQSSAYQAGIGPGSGFSSQDDDRQSAHAKGKAKGGGSSRGNNGGFGAGGTQNMQYQQQLPHQQGGQQQFGLQPGGGGTGGGLGEVSSGSAGGWSNQSWGGGHSWQGGAGN